MRERERERERERKRERERDRQSWSTDRSIPGKGRQSSGSWKRQHDCTLSTSYRRLDTFFDNVVASLSEPRVLADQAAVGAIPTAITVSKIDADALQTPSLSTPDRFIVVAIVNHV